MTVTETEPAEAHADGGGRRFLWPAAYYSSATPKAVLPAWAAYGCGGAGVLVLLIVFAGGIYLSGSGFIDFMDLALGMSTSEMKGQFAADVTAERKKSLEAEIELLRKNLREQKVSVQSLQPFLESVRKTGADSKITGAEAESLETTAKKINATAKRR
ncbi:MAG TPA: hypothetical protein VJZ00_00620 [Thermoanaerobaculia bacterium]|nr:hypothetical protein [Thermoanaerobaculia bacterium]